MVTSRFRADLLAGFGRMENMRIAKLSTRANKNVIASGLMVDDSFSALSLYFDGMIEEVEAERYSRSFQPLCKLRYDARGVEAAFYASAGSESELLEKVDVLQADDISAGSGDLADVGDAAGSVAHARDLDDEVNSRRDLGANGLLGQRNRAHQSHGLNARDGVAGIVGMDRCDGPIMPGVHCLQHVERLFSANLAQDDAVGAHAQRVDHEFALADSALPFEVGRTALEPGDMLLLDLEFGGIFDCDN